MKNFTCTVAPGALLILTELDISAQQSQLTADAMIERVKAFLDRDLAVTV